ncbi:MAG: Fic family protein [Methanocorpusculum sp.]|nr:Fic family protein [Methanocorpusculum sp.]
MEFDPNTPHNSLPFLPPEINLETPKILKACISANTSLALLREAAKLIPNPDILISSIPLLEAAASSEIENIFTTSESLYQALSVKSENVDPSTKEVLNYRAALYAGFNALKTGGKINEETINLVCSTILGTKIERRDVGVCIGNASTRVYTPPNDPYVIQALISQLEEYINGGNEPDPLVRLALIHYQFEAIHPFVDGNGRTGRILNILYLVSKRLLDIPVLYLSRYIIENKSEYYRLLRAVTGNGAFEDWIVFILRAVKETADWTYSRVHAVYDLMNETRNLCREKLPNHMYSHELVEIIFLQPYCKPKYLIEAGIGNRQTAMKYLKELENIGVLKSQKISREVVYVNTELYELLRG